MKVKKIMMTILLAVGFIAAKAATGYPPELVLVSQPVMTYNDYSNTITVYYDVQNIGDYRYKGYVYIYLDPDDGYYYAREWVKVCPGKIKRIAIDIPAYRPNPSYTYTIMPYYELGNELYSFTTFEYFEPLAFRWNGPRTERWVVINVGPRPRYYVRPGDYRYYYDGYRPMLPPPVAGYGPGPMPPMDPHHHTYIYHYNNGGYPGAHYYYDDHGNATPIDHNNQATVRPHDNGTPGSMSNNGAGVNNQNNFNGSGNNGATTRPSSGSSNVSSGSTNRPSSGSNSNGATTRPNSGSSNVSSGSSTNRPSSGNSSVGRTSTSSSSSSSTTARPSSGSSSSNRSGNSNSSSSSRASSSSSSSSRSSGTSSSSSSSRSSNSSSSSSRSGSSSSGARR